MKTRTLIKPMKTSESTVKNQHFQNSINQRLGTIQGVFLQDTQMNLSENCELCDVLTCPIPFSSHQFYRSLEN